MLRPPSRRPWPKPWARAIRAARRIPPRVRALLTSKLVRTIGWGTITVGVGTSALLIDRAPPRAKAATSVLHTHAASPPKTSARLGAVRADTVVLLVIDGIRWQEVFQGVDARLARAHGLTEVQSAARLVPALHELGLYGGVSAGAPGIGAEIRASGPVYRSLPGYMELLSGHSAGYCLSNRCGSVRHPTLMDRISDGAEAGEAALFASWPHLIHAAAMHPERAVISAGRHGGTHLEFVDAAPTRRGLRRQAIVAGPSPSKGDFRADRFTQGLAFDYLLRERPRFLFISLGEADAYGHANNYPAYLNALRRSDRFVARLVDATERLNLEAHRTTLIVTTDHGRDAKAREHGPGIPESARSWLMACGYAVHRRGSIPMAEPRTLSDIAPSVLRLLGLTDSGGLSELFDF